MSPTHIQQQYHGIELEQNKGNDTLRSETVLNKDVMNEALRGEDLEHNQTVWQAVKSHKMACFWSTVMCFTM